MSDVETPSRFWPWFWRVFLVLSLAYAWHSYYVPSNEIAWAGDVAAAQQRATEDGRPVIVFVTGAWCVPCRIMKREVWADADVTRRVNAGFVPVEVDAGDPEAAATLSRYGPVGTPTTIITDAAGDVLASRPGRMDKVEFLALLDASGG